MRVKVYVHVSKEACYDAGKKAGLTDAQLEKFVYAGTEHELVYEVDEDGWATPVMFDLRPLPSL
jgi:SHS2 domain-containing protein